MPWMILPLGMQMMYEELFLMDGVSSDSVIGYMPSIICKHGAGPQVRATLPFLISKFSSLCFTILAVKAVVVYGRSIMSIMGTI